ncbi:nucleotide-diphospho-sugar transferase [Phyllosticta citribraziliensis]|uniref:Nucleotide-diphospho-sugar transferase n=1 Tax=Phyllosticta citribraziliensis TaxID=989973 RepID=A0ABR1LXW9_9PEZI
MLSQRTFCLSVVWAVALFVAVAGQKTENDNHDGTSAAVVSTFLDAWTRPVPLIFFFHLFLFSWSVLTSSFSIHFWASSFVALLVFRYFRTILNSVAYIRLKPTLPVENPKYTNKDVTAIIPTVEPTAATFTECLERIIANAPAQILIVTVGQDNVDSATALSDSLNTENKTRITSISIAKPSKREQIKAAVLYAQTHFRTELIITCDDTVFWPTTLVEYIIAPFERVKVGIVGTSKRVRRNDGPVNWAGFWNLLGVFRLERTNFDLAATWAIDGGMSCVSGRTCAIRSCIFEDPEFLQAYTNEYIFWGRVGPLNAGDDKFVTRWMYKKGWEIAHQKCPEATIETILGVKGGASRYINQCLRWARTSARDNPKMIFREGLWRTHPWLTYSVLFTSFFNYSLFTDPFLFFLLNRALTDASFAQVVTIFTDHPYVVLGLWMLAAKFVRPASHYWRNPRDLIYTPGVILFGYFHSLIKLWALLTCWDIAWGTRAGVDDAAKKKD